MVYRATWRLAPTEKIRSGMQFFVTIDPLWRNILPTPSTDTVNIFEHISTLYLRHEGMYTDVHRCTQMYTLVYISTQMYTLVHRCTQMFGRESWHSPFFLSSKKLASPWRYSYRPSCTLGTFTSVADNNSPTRATLRCFFLWTSSRKER